MAMSGVLDFFSKCFKLWPSSGPHNSLLKLPSRCDQRRPAPTTEVSANGGGDWNLALTGAWRAQRSDVTCVTTIEATLISDSCGTTSLPRRVLWAAEQVVEHDAFYSVSSGSSKVFLMRLQPTELPARPRPSLLESCDVASRPSPPKGTSVWVHNQLKGVIGPCLVFGVPGDPKRRICYTHGLLPPLARSFRDRCFGLASAGHVQVEIL